MRLFLFANLVKYIHYNKVPISIFILQHLYKNLCECVTTFRYSAYEIENYLQY